MNPRSRDLTFHENDGVRVPIPSGSTRLPHIVLMTEKFCAKDVATVRRDATNRELKYLIISKVVYTPHVYVIALDIDGERHTAILKELQFDPVTDAVIHVDFLEVNDTKPITIGIPVKLVGLAQGVRDGGRMNLSIRKINVTAPYQQIPEHLDVDVTALKIGKSIKVGELSYEGLEIATSKEVIVCSIKMTRQAAAAAAAAAE